MSDIKKSFTGRWLHHGEWQGKNFSHELAEYDHDEQTGAAGSTKMRHASIKRDGSAVEVWVPAHWSDDQAREALEINW